MTKNFIIILLVLLLVGAAVWVIYERTQGPVPVISTSPSPSLTMTPAPTLPPVRTLEGGLQVQDLVIGTGAEAKTGMAVAVHYTGWLTDGTKFDSSLDRGQPFQFLLGAGQVIEGWDQGVAGMNVGGKRRLTIPADLGYGAAGAGGVIPPNATLVFEVELLAVQDVKN